MADRISLKANENYQYTDTQTLELENIGDLKYIKIEPVEGEKNADAVASIFPEPYPQWEELETYIDRPIEKDDIISLLVRYYNCIRWRPYKVLEIKYL